MNILDDLKALRKLPFTKLAIQSYIIDFMENFFFSMFDYKDFPESMPKEYAERYLIWYGCAASGNIPEKYNSGLYKGQPVFLKGDPADFPDAYGVGSKLIVTSANGFCETVDYDKFAFGWNNSSHTSLRNFIVLASDAMAKAFVTLRSDVLYAKNHPIYKARDDKEKAALNEYWKKVKDSDGDDDLAIASSNILDELEGVTTGAAQNVINLSDPLNSDKLQYISKVCDDYIRWALGQFGQTIQGNGKLAQQTKDEVNGQTSSSFINPNDMLYQRKLWLERMKKLGIVGSEADIDFSSAWKVEEIKYQKEADIDKNGEIEEVGQEQEEQKEGGENEQEVL